MAEYKNIQEFMNSEKDVKYFEKRVSTYRAIDENWDNLLEYFKKLDCKDNTKETKLAYCLKVLRYYNQDITKIEEYRNLIKDRYKALKDTSESKEKKVQMFNEYEKNIHSLKEKYGDNLSKYSVNDKIIIESLINEYTIRCAIASVKFKNFDVEKDNYIDVPNSKIVYNDTKNGSIIEKILSPEFINLITSQITSKVDIGDYIIFMPNVMNSRKHRENNFSKLVKKLTGSNVSHFRKVIENEKLEETNDIDERVNIIRNNGHSVRTHIESYKKPDSVGKEFIEFAKQNELAFKKFLLETYPDKLSY